MIIIKPAILRVEDATTILPPVPVKRSPYARRTSMQ